MTMQRWTGATVIDLTTAERWTGTVWVPLTVAERWTGTAWVAIPLPGGGGGGGDLLVSVSPGGAMGVVVADSPIFRNVITSAVTATPSFGEAPYSFLWSRISGDSAVNATNPTAASTQFSATVGRNSEKSAVFSVRVTDNLGAVVTVNGIEATCIYESTL